MKVGLSCKGILYNEQKFESLAKAKIDCVEISLEYEYSTILDYKYIASLAKKHGIELWSCHIPFYPQKFTNVSALDKGVRDFTIKYQSELIKKVSAVGIDKFIIHPSVEPLYDKDRPDHMKYGIETFAILAEVASKEGAVICVEDLPRTCLGHTADEVVKLISGDDRLRVCLDTNHLTEDDNMNFINKLGDKIITLHVSDYDFVNERHWLPGEGKIKWQPIYQKLLEIGYKGPWLYEIDLNTPKSIIRDRELIHEDFYDNAMQIFAGKEPTRPAFSHAKPDLGYYG